MYNKFSEISVLYPKCHGSKSGTAVSTERLVTEGNYIKLVLDT